jgi:hypothetical protein
MNILERKIKRMKRKATIEEKIASIFLIATFFGLISIVKYSFVAKYGLKYYLLQ